MIRISKYVEVRDFETKDNFVMMNGTPYIMAKVLSAKVNSGYQQTLEEEMATGKPMVKCDGFAVYLVFVGSMSEGRVRISEVRETLADMAQYYLDEVINRNVRAYRKSAENEDWRFRIDDKHKEEREVSRMAVAIRASEEYVEGDDSDLAEVRRESFLDGAYWYSMNGVHEAKKFRNEE